jgi:subtilisin-like proprotein convertase family protein
MTVHSWGENPRGTWHLEVHNDASVHWGSEAKLHMWSLDLFGTEFDPNAEADKIRSGDKVRPGDKIGSGDTVKKTVAAKRNVEGKLDADLLQVCFQLKVRLG